MDKKTKMILIYIGGSILLLWVLQAYFSEAAIKEIPYSEFKDLVAKNRLQRVVIANTYLTGYGRDKTMYKTVRIEDEQLVPLLEENSIEFKGKVEETWFRTFLLSWVIPIAILVIIWNILFRKMGPGSKVMSFGKTRAKIYAEKEVDVRFTDVAGQDEAKEELQEVITFLKQPEKFAKIGGRLPKGILLVGSPGTGKTLMSKAVAGEAGVPFFSLTGSEFVELFVGMGAMRVRDLFAQAKEKAPCIIFIDELDAIGKARGYSLSGGHDEREQTLNQLLAEMDGFDTRTGVIILGATNRPEILDKALLRAGRFDRHILVDKPDLKEREMILKVHLKNIQTAEDVNVKLLARRTPGFVGADLANLVNEAALLAVRAGKERVTMEECEKAIDRVMTGLEKKNRLITQKEKEIVAFHESGHALVSYYRNPSQQVHKISIIPTGLGALGMNIMLPTEERYLLVKSELLARIDSLLGGRAAEELIFNEVSTGARDDLERATEIAFNMVGEYGMSDKLGPISVIRQKVRFLDEDRRWGERIEMSGKTSQTVDEEVKQIITQAVERARECLQEHIAELKTLAKTLLEKEVIESEEFLALIQSDGDDSHEPEIND